MRITRNHQENLEGITQKTETDIGKDPILEEGMMKIDIGDLKIGMIGLFQEKGLIGIIQNTNLTLETDIEGMTDIIIIIIIIIIINNNNNNNNNNNIYPKERAVQTEKMFREDSKRFYRELGEKPSRLRNHQT